MKWISMKEIDLKIIIIIILSNIYNYILIFISIIIFLVKIIKSYICIYKILINIQIICNK